MAAPIHTFPVHFHAGVEGSTESRGESPASFLTALVDEFGAIARNRGVALRLALSSTLPLLAVDRRRLARALGAIVGCAVHSAPRGGVVTVTASAKRDVVTFTIRESAGAEPPGTYRIAVPILGEYLPQPAIGASLEG